jgi:histone-lysine N-methyltransferase SETD1
MSRASAAGFADFFPAAPRAAKNKAKERQRERSRLLDSPGFAPVSSRQDDSAHVRARDHGSISDRVAHSANGLGTNGAPATSDEHDSPPGDLLNGVGSASSHASTISSVFSAPPAASNFGGRSGPAVSTPLTTDDSSPPGKSASPHYVATGSQIGSKGDSTRSTTWSHVPDPQLQALDSSSPVNRKPIRDPSNPDKGKICVYDPWLDPNLASEREKKKHKAKYRNFDAVCVCLRGASYLSKNHVLLTSFRTMALPRQIRDWRGVGDWRTSMLISISRSRAYAMRRTS